jgi:hypothetical protein
VLLGLAAIGQSTYEAILPQDVASPPGVQAVIKCRLAYQNVGWTFCPKDGSPPYIVAFDCTALQPDSDNFGIDTTNDACHLIIKKMTVRLAGTYTCQDVYSKERHSAILSLANNDNLALKRNAIQSSTYTDAGATMGIASNAVDGFQTSEFSWSKCSCTNDELSPWWAVDLGQETPVGRVRIINRNILPERLSNFYIGLTNVSPWTSAPSLARSSICKFTVANPPAGVPTDYTCDPGTEPGRYLFVMLRGKNFLTICELEAYYY